MITFNYSPFQPHWIKVMQHSRSVTELFWLQPFWRLSWLLLMYMNWIFGTFLIASLLQWWLNQGCQLDSWALFVALANGHQHATILKICSKINLWIKFLQCNNFVYSHHIFATTDLLHYTLSVRLCPVQIWYLPVSQLERQTIEGYHYFLQIYERYVGPSWPAPSQLHS